MSRIVIVARTRMKGDDICVGGHDLDDRFRGVRLLDPIGDHLKTDSPFTVGEVWEIRYYKKLSARPPHVEDIFVMEQRRVRQVADLKALVLNHVQPWTGAPEVLFDKTVRSTGGGSPYIPAKGRLPRCSTGYWIPDSDLIQRRFENRMRFTFTGESAIKGLKWVGVQQPPDRIEAGSLVRVSLSRLFKADNVPEGYYVQISGVL